MSAYGAQGAHAHHTGRAAPGRDECAFVLEPQLEHDPQLCVLGIGAVPGLGRRLALHPDSPGAGPVLQGVALLPGQTSIADTCTM